MTTFHEHKLWQEAYVVLMDIHESFDSVEDGNEEIAEKVIESATTLTAKIADGLSRIDRRFGRQILMDSVGMVAVVRTHLAVAWGRGLVTDDVFRDLDGKYDKLALALQNFR